MWSFAEGESSQNWSFILQRSTHFTFTREFPGGPVVRTSCFYCRRLRFDPLIPDWETKTLQTTQYDQNSFYYFQNSLYNFVDISSHLIMFLLPGEHPLLWLQSRSVGTKFSHLLFFWKCLYFPFVFEIFTLGIKSQVGSFLIFSFYTLKTYFISFCLHSFWWEVCLNSYLCSSIYNMFLFSQSCHWYFV